MSPDSYRKAPCDITWAGACNGKCLNISYRVFAKSRNFNNKPTSLQSPVKFQPEFTATLPGSTERDATATLA